MTINQMSYFDIDAGRGESLRLIFAIGNIDFDDNRVSISDFPELKAKLPLGSLPTITLKDEVLYTQSNAIARYFGKQVGLYPTDPFQAFLCDEVIDIVDEALLAFSKVRTLTDDQVSEYLDEILSGKIKEIIQLLDKRFNSAGGNYFADQQLTIADIKFFELVQLLNMGLYTDIPEDYISSISQSLDNHHRSILSEPAISAYYEARKP